MIRDFFVLYAELSQTEFEKEFSLFKERYDAILSEYYDISDKGVETMWSRFSEYEPFMEVSYDKFAKVYISHIEQVRRFATLSSVDSACITIGIKSKWVFIPKPIEVLLEEFFAHKPYRVVVLQSDQPCWANFPLVMNDCYDYYDVVRPFWRERLKKILSAPNTRVVTVDGLRINRWRHYLKQMYQAFDLPRFPKNTKDFYLMMHDLSWVPEEHIVVIFKGGRHLCKKNTTVDTLVQTSLVMHLMKWWQTHVMYRSPSGLPRSFQIVFEDSDQSVLALLD